MIIHQKRFGFVLGILLCGCVLGCQSTSRQPKHLNPTVSQATRDNCYSLLHQLLAEEKGVNILHYIKREHPGLKELIKRVSVACGDGADQLETFAKADPSLPLDDYNLPIGEQKTRDDISKQKEHDLLHDSGEEFEVTLLLTQVEALGYASHLAKVGAENDTQPERVRYMNALSRQMDDLRREVVARLVFVSKNPSS